MMQKSRSLFQGAGGDSGLSADPPMAVYVPEQTEAPCDAINVLELSSMPLRSARLKRAKLLKNVRLESVVEMFRDTGSGSGQIECSQVYKHFSWPEGFKHPDQQLLVRLGKLPSYDVFSLRVALRRLGIEVDAMASLQLSDEKKSSLASHMQQFTAPLIREIYGDHSHEIEDFDQLINMFRHSDKEAVLDNLKFLANRLQIELVEVPQFLEDYADIALSIAYFQELFDTLVPLANNFLSDLDYLLTVPEFKHDPRFVRDADKLKSAIDHIVAAVAARFEGFTRVTNNMWHDISAKSFRKIRKQIAAHHMAVGGMLCGLSVKVRGWNEAFSELNVDQHQRKRMYFIQGIMMPGIEAVAALDRPKDANLRGAVVHALLASYSGACLAVLGEYEPAMAAALSVT